MGSKNTILQTRDLPLKDSAEMIVQRVHAWNGNDMLTDDASLIAVEFT